RDDFVAAALDAEPVDVVATKQHRKIASRLTEVHALRPQLVPIEDDLRLRLIELDVRVGVDEQPGGERLLHELTGDLVEPLRLRSRADHEIDREVTASGKRRRGQRNRADARNLR